MKLAALYLLLALPAPLAAEPRHDIVVLAERERPHLVLVQPVVGMGRRALDGGGDNENPDRALHNAALSWQIG